MDEARAGLERARALEQERDRLDVQDRLDQITDRNGAARRKEPAIDEGGVEGGGARLDRAECAVDLPAETHGIFLTRAVRVDAVFRQHDDVRRGEGGGAVPVMV